MRESEKCRHIILPYCIGPGIELGSQGAPVCDTSWNFELPESEFATYNANNPPYGPIQLRGDAFKSLPIEPNSLGYCIASHLLEDAPTEQWPDILKMWVDTLRPGGHLIILIPDKDRWAKALERGQRANCAHKHEGKAGELSGHAAALGLDVVMDDYVKPHDEKEYGLIFIGKKQ